MALYKLYLLCYTGSIPQRHVSRNCDVIESRVAQTGMEAVLAVPTVRLARHPIGNAA